MGTITETIRWNSTLNADTDAADLIRAINESVVKSGPTLSVFFLAETHRNPFDMRRGELVFTEFSKAEYAKRVTLLVERGLFEDDPPDHVVSEGRSDLQSADDARNKRAVSLLVDYMQHTKTGVVVVFFGENHLVRIREELAKQTPSTIKIRWIESLSFTTAFDAMQFNEAARFDLSELQPAGYAAQAADTLAYQYLRLLTKGRFGMRFMVQLYPKDLAKSMTRGTIYAIYFKDPKRHAEVQADVDESGGMDLTFETFDGSSIAVAVAERSAT